MTQMCSSVRPPRRDFAAGESVAVTHLPQVKGQNYFSSGEFTRFTVGYIILRGLSSKILGLRAMHCLLRSRKFFKSLPNVSSPTINIFTAKKVNKLKRVSPQTVAHESFSASGNAKELCHEKRKENHHSQ